MVLSDELWRRRFNGSREVAGTKIILNGAPFTVLGVASKDFRGMHSGLNPALWLPIRGEGADRGARQYFITGRLQPGINVKQARAQLDRLSRRLQSTYPATNEGVHLTVLPEPEGRVHPVARPGLLSFSGVLVAVAALVLVVACININCILFVWAASRRKEIATRLALGATRGRIIRQLLTESAVLSVLGGGLGYLLALGATTVLGAINFPTRVPLYFDVAPDSRALCFSFAITVLSGILFGLTPALDATKSDLASMLKAGEAPTQLQRWRFRAPVTIQVAVATTLLLCAGLSLRNLQNALHMDVGFDPEGVVLTSIDVGLQGYSPTRAAAFWQRLRKQLSALPGAQSVSLASSIPFELNITTMNLAPEGGQPSKQGGFPVIDFASVDSAYFQTLRIPLLEGRDFTTGDTQSSRRIVIVNDVLARQFWPGESAVGKRMTLKDGGTIEVVGVAKRGRYLTLGEQPKPYAYLPLSQGDAGAMTVLLRGSGTPAAVMRQIRDTVAGLDNTAPVYNVTTMSEHVNFALFPAKAEAVVLNVLGVQSLLLMALGLYGTLANTVNRRTYEIGVRRALGARDSDIVALVARKTMLLVAAGLVIGLIAGLAGSRVLGSLLYGVDVWDSSVFGIAPFVILLISFLACSPPTYNALRIAAARALKYE